MVALALYCATSVYISQAKKCLDDTIIDNLEFIIRGMDAIGKEHIITRSFLRQAVLDIQRNNIITDVEIPWFDKYAQEPTPCGHNIPLLARSSVSRHSRVQPPLPGRLPLNNPAPTAYGRHTDGTGESDNPPPGANIPLAGNALEPAGNKRRRMKSPGVSTATWPPGMVEIGSWDHGSGGHAGFGKMSDKSAHVLTSPINDATPAYISAMAQVKLPHRMGSAATSPSATQNTPSTSTQTRTSSDTPAGPSDEAIDHSPQVVDIPQITMDMFSGLDNWDLTDAQLIEAVRNGSFGASTGATGGAEGGDPWASLVDGNGSWDTGGGSG